MMPIVILALAASLALPAEPRPAESLWWVFLNKGPNRSQAEAELTRMQREHLGHLERLWKEGKSPLAGLLGDDGVIRGIVVVRAPAESLLGADPAVRAQHLAIELHPQYLADGILGQAPPR